MREGASRLVSDTALNLFVVLVTLSAMTFAFLAMVLFVGAASRRIGVVVRERNLASLMQRWRFLFKNGVASDKEQLPRIRYREAFAVLNLWNGLHRVRGGRNPDDHAFLNTLNKVARASEFARAARSLLRHGLTGDCVVAITTLGYLSSLDDVTLLRKYARDVRGEVSFAAHRALVMISPAQIGVFVEMLRRRDDWSSIEVKRFFRDLGPVQISTPLCRAVATSDDEHALRLLRYLHFCDAQRVHDTLLKFLKKRRSTSSTVSGLRELGRVVRTTDRSFLNNFIFDERHKVRLAATHALMPIVAAEDEPVIARLLSDPDPRIRYYAGLLLLATPSGRFRAEKLREATSDNFSRNILTQVLAEERLSSRGLPVGREARSANRTGGPFDRRIAGSMRRHK